MHAPLIVSVIDNENTMIYHRGTEIQRNASSNKAENFEVHDKNGGDLSFYFSDLFSSVSLCLCG
jgi:hypothetical protein